MCQKDAMRECISVLVDMSGVLGLYLLPYATCHRPRSRSVDDETVCPAIYHLYFYMEMGYSVSISNVRMSSRVTM